MRLRSNELCPIHKSLSCCGRELIPKPKLMRLGVQRVEDPYHPRGYRELRSPAETRKLLNRKILQQGGICAICHEDFTDYNDVVRDHKNPKGMGGARRQPAAILRAASVGPENGMRWHPSSKQAEFCRLTLSRPMLFCD